MLTDLFGPNVRRRQAIRATPNPMDKATVISIYPKELNETKYTIQPGKFHIPAGSVEKPVLVVVGPSSWWREIDPEQPLLEITNSAIQVADSITTDYCAGLLGYKRAESCPGLFWVPGSWKSADDIKKHNFEEINITGEALFKRAEVWQTNYWKTLVKLADIGWTKTNGNPLVISDDMRFAATKLNLKEKPWMKDMQMMAMINCPMCGTLRNPAYPMCPNCKAVVDTDAANKLGIKFAQ